MGLSNDKEVEVLSGLEEGAKVMLIEPRQSSETLESPGASTPTTPGMAR